MHTGSRAFCILMALAATGTEAATASAVTTTGRTPVQPGHYRVEAKVVSVPAALAKDISATMYNGYYSDDVVAHLARNSQACVLSLPSVDSANASSSKIEVTKKVALPGGKSRDAGVWLNVAPNIHASDLRSVTLSLQNVRFGGFADRKGAQPIFSTQRVTTTLTIFHDVATGYYCVNVPVSPKVPTTYDADGRRSASIADANERQLLFVKISRG